MTCAVKLIFDPQILTQYFRVLLEKRMFTRLSNHSVPVFNPKVNFRIRKSPQLDMF
jgi:hypothetical protein